MKRELRWRTETGDAARWDALVAASDDRNIYQTSGWGEYRQRAGWHPIRWSALDKGGGVVLAVQLLVKRVFGVRIGWAPGGPLLGFPSSRRVGIAHLPAALSRRLPETCSPGYARLQSQLPREPELAYAFEQSFARPARLIGAAYTLWHELAVGPGVIERRLNDHHRYYVRKSLRSGLRFEARTDDATVERLAALQEEVRTAKPFASLRRVGADNLLAMRRSLGETFVFVAVADNEIVSACLISLFANRAHLLAAATGRRGRDLGASYGLIFRLLEYLRERGAESFDFGAVDPHQAGSGVSFFKLGFGGRLREYLGEWEWASHAWLRQAMALALRVR